MHRDADGRGQPEHRHGRRIADEQHVDAGAVGEYRGRIVVRREKHRRLAARFQRGERGDGDFLGNDGTAFHVQLVWGHKKKRPLEVSGRRTTGCRCATRYTSLQSARSRMHMHMGMAMTAERRMLTTTHPAPDRAVAAKGAVEQEAERKVVIDL